MMSTRHRVYLGVNLPDLENEMIQLVLTFIEMMLTRREL